MRAREPAAQLANDRHDRSNLDAGRMGSPGWPHAADVEQMAPAATAQPRLRDRGARVGGEPTMVNKSGSLATRWYPPPPRARRPVSKSELGPKAYAH